MMEIVHSIFMFVRQWMSLLKTVGWIGYLLGLLLTIVGAIAHAFFPIAMGSILLLSALGSTVCLTFHYFVEEEIRAGRNKEFWKGKGFTYSGWR